MPNPTRARAAIVFAAALVAVTCSFPDDQSADVYVVVTQDPELQAQGVLGEGETRLLSARAFRRVGAAINPTADVEIRNVEFFWFSDNENIATVRGGAAGGVDVTGEGPGVVAVRARPKQFEGAQEGTTVLRVASLYEVDSVRPSGVRYGEKVTLFGVRMHLTLGAALSGEELIVDPFSFAGNRDGLGRIELWVPPRATSSRLTFIGPGLFGQSDSVSVTEVDRYEPDAVVPARLDINGAGAQPTVGEKLTLFFNPALAYEPVPVGQSAVDWFRFVRADTSQAVTFILNSTVLNDTAFSYLSDTIAYIAGGYFIVPGSFILSPGFYVCENESFFPAEQRSVSTIIALRDLPDTSLQLLSFYARDGRYELVAVKGYHTVDRRIGPDRFEENDLWCKYADRNFADPARQIIIGPLTPPFVDTLTIDNPHDVDWYRFRVTLADTVTVQTRPRPLGGGVDASDIDLYLMRVSDFAQIGTDQTPGSFGKIKLFLPAGDYYLAVVDRIGVPTRYGMCIIRGVACTPPGGAPGATALMAPRSDVPVVDATVPPSWWTGDRRRLPSPRP